MSETKFTPGPWIICIQDDNNCANTIFAKSQLKDGRITAEDWDFDICTTGIDHENYEANAHLIAAAPDLYEAVKDCVDVLKRNQYHTTTAYLERLLAKARGE